MECIWSGWSIIIPAIEGAKTLSTIISVPGSFTLPAAFDPIMNSLAARRISAHALHLPSIGLSPNTGRPGTPPPMYDDIASIASEVQKEADRGHDVTLVAHSYGVIPATESLESLSKLERNKQGKNGGVVRLAYIAALVREVGVAAG